MIISTSDYAEAKNSNFIEIHKSNFRTESKLQNDEAAPFDLQLDLILT